MKELIKAMIGTIMVCISVVLFLMNGAVTMLAAVVLLAIGGSMLAGHFDEEEEDPAE